MKNTFVAVLGLVALGLSVPAHADLVVSATVEYAGAQRNLIYDTDLNITWLDYSNGPNIWSNQIGWADELSFTINGATYDNWRLPSTVDCQFHGSYPSYDGSNSYGFNNTTSEMGHLYYTELANKGLYATDGSTQAGYGLNNTGPFTNLVSDLYWSGTEDADYLLAAWGFFMFNGAQSTDFKHLSPYRSGLAVLPGQIQSASVPEPASMLLVVAGLVGLVGLKRRKK